MRASAHRQLVMFDSARDAVDVITLTVCESFGTDVKIVRSASQRQPFARIRMIVMYASRQLTELTHKEIGKVLGRDHSTVVAGVQEIEAALEFDPFLRKSVRDVLDKAQKALALLSAS